MGEWRAFWGFRLFAKHHPRYVNRVYDSSIPSISYSHSLFWPTSPLAPNKHTASRSRTQVDDLFLRTGQYIKDNQRGSWEDAVRVTGQDLENHKIWQDELNANLPASSRVVIVCGRPPITWRILHFFPSRLSLCVNSAKLLLHLLSSPLSLSVHYTQSIALGVSHCVLAKAVRAAANSL